MVDTLLSFSNYRPQFYLRTADINGKVELPENVKMVMPGDNVTAMFELILPVPLETGQRFALREGGRTVGAGMVSKVMSCLEIHLQETNCQFFLNKQCIKMKAEILPVEIRDSRN